MVPGSKSYDDWLSDGSMIDLLMHVEFFAHNDTELNSSLNPFSVHDDEHDEPMLDKSLVASLVPFDLPPQKISSPTAFWGVVELDERSTRLHSMVVPTAEKEESRR
jgi:hypothetical protein